MARRSPPRRWTKNVLDATAARMCAYGDWMSMALVERCGSREERRRDTVSARCETVVGGGDGHAHAVGIRRGMAPTRLGGNQAPGATSARASGPAVGRCASRCIHNAGTGGGADQVLDDPHLAVVAARTDAQGAPGERLIAVAILGGGRGVVDPFGSRHGAEEVSAAGQVLTPVTMAQEAVIPDGGGILTAGRAGARAG